VHTIVRLLSFLRPYRVLVVITTLAAAGIMVCSAAIPWITRLVIDRVIGGRSA